MKMKFANSTWTAKASLLPLIVTLFLFLMSAGCSSPESSQPGESARGATISHGFTEERV